MHTATARSSDVRCFRSELLSDHATVVLADRRAFSFGLSADGFHLWSLVGDADDAGREDFDTRGVAYAGAVSVLGRGKDAIVIGGFAGAVLPLPSAGIFLRALATADSLDVSPHERGRLFAGPDLPLAWYAAALRGSQDAVALASSFDASPHLQASALNGHLLVEASGSAVRAISRRDLEAAVAASARSKGPVCTWAGNPAAALPGPVAGLSQGIWQGKFDGRDPSSLTAFATLEDGRLVPISIGPRPAPRGGLPPFSIRPPHASPDSCGTLQRVTKDGCVFARSRRGVRQLVFQARAVVPATDAFVRRYA